MENRVIPFGLLGGTHPGLAGCSKRKHECPELGKEGGGASGRSAQRRQE